MPYVYFKKGSFIFHADCKSILKPVSDNKNDGPKIEIFQDLILYSNGYKLVCVGKQYSRPDKSYLGEDVADLIFIDMAVENENWVDVGNIFR